MNKNFMQDMQGLGNDMQQFSELHGTDQFMPPGMVEQGSGMHSQGMQFGQGGYNDMNDFEGSMNMQQSIGMQQRPNEMRGSMNKIANGAAAATMAQMFEHGGLGEGDMFADMANTFLFDENDEGPMPLQLQKSLSQGGDRLLSSVQQQPSLRMREDCNQLSRQINMGMGMQQGMGGEFGGNDMQTATQAGQSTMVQSSPSLQQRSNVGASDRQGSARMQGSLDCTSQYWEQLAKMRAEHLKELNQSYVLLYGIANKQPQSERARELKDRAMVFRQRVKEAIDWLSMDPTDPRFTSATFTYLDLERLNNLDNDIRINMDRMREERIQKLLDVLHDQPEGDGQNCVDAQMGPWGSDQMLGGGAVGGNGFGVDGMGSLGGGAVGEGPGGQAITEEYLRKVHDRQLSQARQQGATEDQILMLRRRQQAQIFQFKRKQQQQSGGIGDGSRPNMSPEQLQQVHKSQIDNLQQDGATSQQLQALQPRQQQQQQQLTQSMLNAGVVSAQRPQITVQHLQQLQDQQLAAARDRGASAHEIQMMQQRHRQQMATLQQQQAGQGGAQASPSLPPTGPVGSSVPQATSQQMQQVHERQIMMLQQQGASDSYIQQIQQKQQAQMNNLLRQQSANSPSPNASGLQGSNFAGMSSSLQTPQLSGQPSPSLGGAAGGGGMPQVTAQQLQQMHERQLNQARQQGASDIQIQQLQLRQQQQLNALHQQQQGSGVNRITNSNSPNFGSPTVTPMQLRQMQERQLQQAQSQGATDEQLQQLRHRHHQQLNALQQQQQLEGSDNLLNRSSSTGGAHRPTPQQLQQLHERQLGQAMQQGASEEQICQLKQQQQQQMTLLRQQLGSLVGSPSLGGRVGSGMGGATPTPQQLQQIHEKQVSQARLHGASDQQIQAMQQRHQVQMATLQQQAGNSGLMQMESISILPVGSGGNQISSMQQMHERQLTQARMQGATEQQIQQLQHRQKQQMMAAQQKQQQQASLGGIVGDNQGSIMGCDSGFRPMGDMGQMSIQRLQQMHEHQLAQAKEQGASEQQLINLQQRQQQQLAALRQQQQQGGNHQLMAQAVTNAPFLGNSDAGLPPANSFRLQQMHEQQLAQAKENGASEQQLLQLKERHRQQLAALQQRIGVTGSQAAAGSMMGGNGSGGQITPQQLQQLQERQMSQARMQGATDQQLQLLQQRHQQQMAALHRQLNGGSGISAWPGDGTGMPQQTMTPHRLQQMQENQLAQARQQGATEQQIQQLKQRHQQQMAALQQQMGGSNPNHAIMMGSIGANQPGPQMTPQQLRQLQERQLNNARQQGATDQQIHQMHLRHQQQMQALQKQQLGGSLVNTGAETPSPCQMTTQQLKAIQEKQLSQALSKGATAEQIDALQLRHQQQMMMLQQQQQGLGSDVQMSPQQLQQMHEKQLNQAKLQGATDQQIQSMQQRHQAQLAALQQQCSSSANFGPEMTERQLKEFHDKQLAHAKQQKASQQQLQALQQRQQAQMVSLQRRLSVQQQPKSPALSQPQSQPMQQMGLAVSSATSGAAAAAAVPAQQPSGAHGAPIEPSRLTQEQPMEAYDTDHVSGLDAAGELVQADSLDLDAANQRTSSSGLGSLRELFASGGDDGLSTSKIDGLLHGGSDGDTQLLTDQCEPSNATHQMPDDPPKPENGGADAAGVATGAGDVDHENPLESLGIGSGEGKDAPGAAVGNGKRKLESVFGDGDDKKGSKPKVARPAP